MNTLNKILLVSLLIIIAIAGCSPAIENLDASTATNTPDLKPTNTPDLNPTNTPDLNPTNTQLPSSRLVGHWKPAYEVDYFYSEFYLGELSPDGKGKLYTTYDFVDYCERTYEIISENGDTYIVRFYKDYTTKYLDYSIEFRDDNFILSYVGEKVGEFTYVDSETEPENLGPLAEMENEFLTTNSLTGHWGYMPEADEDFDENWHVYFGKINDDGEGIYYSSGEGNALKFFFKIVNEDGRDYDLILKNECGGDDIPERWEVSEDGQNLNWILEDRINRFKYIDSNTEP